MERRQRLAAHRVGAPLEQHLDLGVVAVRRILGQPATGLVVEVLQVVFRPLSRCRFGQHFAVGIALASSMDRRQILEEQARAPEARQQCPVMIAWKGIQPRLDVSEVLAQEAT